ncbi:serine/arginine repetitive matrix protein 3-like isoform X2 [Lathamus discolor]|uniref:serine/arginine repetitive matrix protein 3-like isoform X2 n=1 Tax=Lathamus discolor TaxID=678569 RepID=UPI0032B84B52
MELPAEQGHGQTGGRRFLHPNCHGSGSAPSLPRSDGHAHISLSRAGSFPSPPQSPAGQLAPIDRSGQPGAGPGTALTSGAKVQPGDCAAAAGQLVPGPRSTMRLGLLCGLTAAAALMVVAGADHGDTKVTQRREESRSMSWRASEDDEGQPRRRERDRREDKEPAQPETPRHRPAAGTGNSRAASGPPPGPICEPADGDTGVTGSPGSPRRVLQEVLSAQTAWQGAKLGPRHSPAPGENGGPGQAQAMP